MKRVFADSNVFLRLFTDDDTAQQEKAARLLAAAEEGEVLLVSGPPVLFEVAWTLRSFYKLSREQVLDVISRVLATRGLELTDRHLVEEAVRRARAAQQDFADAYIAASVACCRCEDVATFNREHFERLGVNLHEL